MTPEDRKKVFYVTAGLGLAFVAYRYRHKLTEPIRKWKNPLGHREIVVVEQPGQHAEQVISMLKDHTSKYKVLGFDVEWVTLTGKRRPCALLQLSSYKGLCALFRLCYMQQIPKSLRELLEDEAIIKVGVGPQDDAQKLSHDYGVGVASTLDLRFLAAMTGHKAEGLAKLSKSILNVQLDKHWRIVCSDWEARTLTEKQLHYAANDALVAIEIFSHLTKELQPKDFWSRFTGKLSAAHVERLEPFFEVRFTEGLLTNLISKKSEKALAARLKGISTAKKPWRKADSSRGICTRAKVFYDNCLLQAPDGELLCTIDRKKAQWYVEQGLGEAVPDCETFTVRLNFEPAGRAVGEVGRYYQTPKENQCVVCGRRDVYIRKNVVPREYRRHFPVVMKSHTSHDILLLCPNCHQLSNVSDVKIRRKLAELCDAPLANTDESIKLVEIPELKQLRSAARALLQKKNALPEQRREVLEHIVLQHYKDEKELTNELLHDAANADVTNLNENYCEHGKKVVQSYEKQLGGLVELEKLWREHFLHTMQPQFLPALWNVNHNANRLEIRAQEGRIDKADLITAGLEASEEDKDKSSSEKRDIIS